MCFLLKVFDTPTFKAPETPELPVSSYLSDLLFPDINPPMISSDGFQFFWGWILILAPAVRLSAELFELCPDKKVSPLLLSNDSAISGCNTF